MAKGGRYLNKNKPEKKKSKGITALVTVLVILILLGIGGYLGFRLVMGSMLGNVNRAEVIEQNSDKSYEDLIAEMYGSMDQSGGEDAGEAEDAYIPEAEEDDVYLPEDFGAELPAETSVG